MKDQIPNPYLELFANLEEKRLGQLPKFERREKLAWFSKRLFIPFFALLILLAIVYAALNYSTLDSNQFEMLAAGSFFLFVLISVLLFIMPSLRFLQAEFYSRHLEIEENLRKKYYATFSFEMVSENELSPSLFRSETAPLMLREWKNRVEYNSLSGTLKGKEVRVFDLDLNNDNKKAENHSLSVVAVALQKPIEGSIHFIPKKTTAFWEMLTGQKPSGNLVSNQKLEPNYEIRQQNSSAEEVAPFLRAEMVDFWLKFQEEMKVSPYIFIQNRFFCVLIPSVGVSIFSSLFDNFQQPLSPERAQLFFQQEFSRKYILAKSLPSLLEIV